jgi:hypothetical protein
MTKLWTKALVILVLVAPAGLIPADKTADSTTQQSVTIARAPTHRSTPVHGKPSDSFSLFAGGNAFGLSPNSMNATTLKVEGEARVRMLARE